MKHVLLLGAGFSRNWGGWLASEVYEYLIGCTQVRSDPELRKLVTNHKYDFEGALGQLQSNYRNAKTPEARQRLLALQSAVCEMFEQMEAAFRIPEIEAPPSLAGPCENDRPRTCWYRPRCRPFKRLNRVRAGQQ